MTSVHSVNLCGESAMFCSSFIVDVLILCFIKIFLLVVASREFQLSTSTVACIRRKLVIFLLHVL